MIVWIVLVSDPDVNPENGVPTENEERDRWLEIESNSKTSILSSSTGHYSESVGTRTGTMLTKNNESEEDNN